MVISEEVEFAGSAIRAEKKNDNDVIHIVPREKHVQSFFKSIEPIKTLTNEGVLQWEKLIRLEVFQGLKTRGGVFPTF